MLGRDIDRAHHKILKISSKVLITIKKIFEGKKTKKNISFCQPSVFPFHKSV